MWNLAQVLCPAFAVSPWDRCKSFMNVVIFDALAHHPLPYEHHADLGKVWKPSDVGGPQRAPYGPYPMRGHATVAIGDAQSMRNAVSLVTYTVDEMSKPEHAHKAKTC